MTDDETQKPVLGFFKRSNPTPDWNNPPQKENEGMAKPTAEEIKEAMPVKPKTTKPVEPKKTASEEEKKTYEEHLKVYHEEWNSYYEKLQAVGMTILKAWYSEKNHDILTASRPFSGLTKTKYYSESEEVKKHLHKKDKEGLGKRSAEIGHAIQLASQENWLGKASIPDLDKLTWEEKFALIGWKNEEPKKEVLKQYLAAGDDKRTVKNLKGAMTRGEKKKATKAEADKEKAPKAKAQPAVAKAKPVVGKKEIEALLKQAETAEKELTKAKSDVDKAIDRVREVHGKLKEELLVTKRLMERTESK